MECYIKVPLNIIVSEDNVTARINQLRRKFLVEGRNHNINEIIGEVQREVTIFKINEVFRYNRRPISIPLNIAEFFEAVK